MNLVELDRALRQLRLSGMRKLMHDEVFITDQNLVGLIRQNERAATQLHDMSVAEYEGAGVLRGHSGNPNADCKGQARQARARPGC